MGSINIQIEERENQKYSVFVDENYFRMCWGYIDLSKCIESLIKARFEKDLEGNV